MNLGRTETIDGAKCWPVRRAPGGISAFPSLEIEFDGNEPQRFHPVNCPRPFLLCPLVGANHDSHADIFSHPSVAHPTHCKIAPVLSECVQ